MAPIDVARLPAPCSDATPVLLDAPGLRVERVEPLWVLSLRHWPGDGSAALAGVLDAHGLAALPAPGRSSGSARRLIWRSPSETLLVTQDATCATTLLEALRPRPGAQVVALDLSAGSLGLAMQGETVDALLLRLVDASALPCGVDDATPLRLADIAAMLWRPGPRELRVIVDRCHESALYGWLNRAVETGCVRAAGSDF